MQRKLASDRRLFNKVDRCGVSRSSAAGNSNSDVGLMYSVNAAGTYSPNISPLRKVTSLRHDGAMVATSPLKRFH
jgi:hypothetical protein